MAQPSTLTTGAALAQPNDLDGFVAKAVKLAQDSQLRNRMAAAARAAACEATWDKINNKVAWRMADTIAERQREQGGTPQSAQAMPAVVQQLVPIYGWLMMNGAMRDVLMRRIVDARLMGGLGVIISFWAVTGIYMVFTEILLWTKGRLRAGERRASVSVA